MHLASTHRLKHALHLAMLMLLLPGCCGNDIDEMTLYWSDSDLSTECGWTSIVWNGRMEARSDSSVVVDANAQTASLSVDWVQFFDAEGRVPTLHRVERDFQCNNGCPGDLYVFQMPPPGLYSMVHFADDGVTVWDEELASFDGRPALVTEVLVQ